jgi:uncharacterized protein YneF (UPF0154 family)
MNNDQKDQNNIEVTLEEIKHISEVLENAFDMALPETETKRLTQLVKELAKWQQADIATSSTSSLSKITNELKDIVSSVDGTTEAYKLIALVPLKERQRITDAIREIIIQYRPIEDNPDITEKTEQLIKDRYGIDLSESQLEQTIQYLTRKLWVEEGLDRSLEDCVDDILHDPKQHIEIQKALDWAAQNLKD